MIEALPIPGKFYEVNEAGELADALSKALRPSLRASVETVGNVPFRPLSVGSTGADWRWSEPGLPPGGYRLVARAGERVEREITLNRGDLLLVQLAERGAVDLERVLFTDELPQRPGIARPAAGGSRSSATAVPPRPVTASNSGRPWRSGRSPASRRSR